MLNILRLRTTFVSSMNSASASTSLVNLSGKQPAGVTSWGTYRWGSRPMPRRLAGLPLGDTRSDDALGSVGSGCPPPVLSGRMEG